MVKAIAPTNSCAEWLETPINGASGSASFETCLTDTIALATSAFTTSSTADKQYALYREVCGDGEILIHVSGMSPSGGFAGLELREDTTAGAKKFGLKTQLSSQIGRFYRSTVNGSATQQNQTIQNIRWLKLTRSGNSLTAHVSTTGQSWTQIMSQTISMDTCILAGVIAHSYNTTTTITSTFDSPAISGFTAPSGPPTTVFFMQDTLVAQAGDTVQICVGIANPCICSPTSASIVLQGNGIPHLSEYNTTSLIFENSTSELCFALPIGNLLYENTYSLVLQNSNGGNGAIVISPDTTILHIVTGSEFAYFCGAAPFLTSETYSFEPKIAFDRFGNVLSRRQLLPQSDTTISGNNLVTTCGCEEVGITLSYFELWFEDCAFSTGSGFNVTGQLGENRRRVMCAVFQYLESLIMPNISLCNTGQSSKVNIRVMPSGPLADYYGDVLTLMNPLHLGYASAYYPNLTYNPGIVLGIPETIIHTGEYPANFSNAEMHAYIRINFERNWHLDYTEDIPPSTPDNPIHDLYSVCLHEALHALGFVSAFTYNADGQGLLGNRFGQGAYFNFDRFLGMDYDGDSLIETPLIVNGSPVNSFPGSPVWSYNTAINPNTDMHQSCLGGDTEPDMRFLGTMLHYPVFTYFTMLNGSSFSHLEGSCDVIGSNPIPYVMNPGLPPSTARRILHDDELDILSQIGYNIGSGCDVGGVNDGVNANNCGDFSYVLEICPPGVATLSIPFEELLSNDPNAESIGYIMPLDAMEGTGAISIDGLHYNYTAYQLGTSELLYAPIGCNGSIGNPTLIRINVVPIADGTCPFYCEEVVNCSEANIPFDWEECESYLGCNELSCNIICNGQFCATVAASSNQLLYEIGNTGNGHYRTEYMNDLQIQSTAIIPGWIRTGGTPDYYFEGPVYPNSIGLGSYPGYFEGVMSYVDLSNGTDYLLSFETGWTNPLWDKSYLNINLISGQELLQGDYLSTPPYTGNIQTLFSGNGLLHPSQKYKRGLFFTCSSQVFNSIWLSNNVGNNDESSGTFIDNIELIEDSFSAGSDLNTQYCYETVSLGSEFCMLTNLGVKYEWFEVTLDGQGNENLIPLASYRVLNGLITNINGNIDPDTHELTVAPAQTTTYRLRRSIFFQVGFPNGFNFCESMSDGTFSANCKNEDDVTVFVSFPIPDASFSYFQNGCSFSFVSNETSPGLQHVWHFGNSGQSSTQMNPIGIILPFGVHEITHTITSPCGVVTYSEFITSIAYPEPDFVVVSEICGLVSFSISDLQAGDSWQIDYGDGSSGTSLTHNYGLSPATYMATLTVVNACETIDLNVEVIVAGCPELDCCPSNSAMLLINTTISAAVEAGLHPGGTSLDLCIEGTLTIDEDYTFSGNLYLAPDATIIITAEATLELDGAHLQGCEFLWNGILVQQPHINDAPSLVSHNETLIEDAKLAVNAANKVILDIRKTTFNRNFVGVYLVGVPLSGFYGNTFDCTSPLKPSISPAPYLGEYAYAGIQSRGSTMHIGVAGTTVNTFQNLRNGILNLRGDLRVENSVFYDIEKAPGEPYDYTGYGIHHQGSDFTQLDQRGLGYSTNATLTFDNCYTAVWADKGNVKARFNRMTAVHTGIHAQYCKNFSIDINHNRINCYGIGIGLLQNDPAGSITVWENHLYVNADSPNNTSGVGIFVQESGTQQSNAIIEQNPIYLYRKDRGIYLNSATGYTIRDNDLFLENAAIDGARGIVLENGKMCRVSCNNVIGNGPGEGLVANSTSATLYSCNSVENLRVGAAFNGASSATYLRATDFVLPLTQGLLYRENIAMMPVQSHSGNLWESGSYGQAAAVHLGSGTQDYFTDQRFEIHTTSAPYYPPSISLPNSSVDPSDWFTPSSGNPLVCNPLSECPILGFAPEDESIKDREEQLADGDFEGEWPGGLHWAAQGQLFEKLERAPGIMDTSTIMADFYAAKENEELGSLFALRKEIDSLMGLLPESFDTLQVYMSLTDSLLEALSFADSLAVNNPQAAIPGLPQQLLARCDSLLVLSQELAGNLSGIRVALVDTLKALNESIADTAIYVSNEKIVNGIYLTTLAQDSTTLDTAQADSLYAVAIQCPEEGGPAVYRARSLYALIELSDFDTLSCLPAAFSVHSRPREMPVSLRDKTPEFQVFPNPNQGRFTIKYQLERDGILVMTDMLGRPAFTRPMYSLVSRMNVTTSEFKPGCYYLYITSDSGEMLHVEKVIIY